jgi:hypothetical protein
MARSSTALGERLVIRAMGRIRVVASCLGMLLPQRCLGLQLLSNARTIRQSGTPHSQVQSRFRGLIMIPLISQFLQEVGDHI